MDTIGIGPPDCTIVILQWSHDFSAMDTGFIPLDGCAAHPPFNGAMTSQPWIRLLRPHGLAWYEDLQWSHDFSAMDTFAAHVWQPARGEPSMEP